MALNNFVNLKAKVRDQSKRKDATEAILEDAIVQAEQEMYGNEEQPLKTTPINTRATASLSTTSRYLALPDGYIDMRRLKVNIEIGAGNDPVWRDVKFRSPDQLAIKSVDGWPGFFTVTSQLEFDRVADQAYTIEMDYISKPSPISATNATNTILTNYPNIYLFGSLWALWLFYKEEELSEFYYEKFMKSIRGANKVERDKSFGNAPVIRQEGVTP